MLCPAFGGERVYFDKQGFNHLIRKGRVPREAKEAEERLEMIDYAQEIIAMSTEFASHRHSPAKQIPNGKLMPSAKFWAFKGSMKLRSVIVVVRQIGSGHKHFFSIMRKTSVQSTKTPKGL